MGREDEEAYVTLTTNDVYAVGALVLARSLRLSGATRKLVCLLTPNGVSPFYRSALSRCYDELLDVPPACDLVTGAPHERPDIAAKFTKLQCWKLVQYRKCVFLDSDTLVLHNCDDLFDRAELSACPDPGWPDLFNTGVFVFTPCHATYESLLQFAKANEGCCEGGEQGLLNAYFSDWPWTIARHLPFVYNVIPQSFYSYHPAVRRFAPGVKICHFAGYAKPWHRSVNPHTGRVVGGSKEASGNDAVDYLQRWWDVLSESVLPLLQQCAEASEQQQWPLPRDQGLPRAPVGSEMHVQCTHWRPSESGATEQQPEVLCHGESVQWPRRSEDTRDSGRSEQLLSASSMQPLLPRQKHESRDTCTVQHESRDTCTVQHEQQQQPWAVLLANPASHGITQQVHASADGFTAPLVVPAFARWDEPNTGNASSGHGHPPLGHRSCHAALVHDLQQQHPQQHLCQQPQQLLLQASQMPPYDQANEGSRKEVTTKSEESSSTTGCLPLTLHEQLQEQYGKREPLGDWRQQPQLPPSWMLWHEAAPGAEVGRREQWVRRNAGELEQAQPSREEVAAAEAVISPAPSPHAEAAEANRSHGSVPIDVSHSCADTGATQTRADRQPEAGGRVAGREEAAVHAEPPCPPPLNMDERREAWEDYNMDYKGGDGFDFVLEALRSKLNVSDKNSGGGLRDADTLPLPGGSVEQRSHARPGLTSPPPRANTEEHRAMWERGQIDYSGVDRFDNILKQLESRLTAGTSSNGEAVARAQAPSSSLGRTGMPAPPVAHSSHSAAAGARRLSGSGSTSPPRVTLAYAEPSPKVVLVPFPHHWC